MSFPIVKRNSKITEATFDLKAYVREVILGLVFGVVGLSLFVVLFILAIELTEPDEYDLGLDEVGSWCAVHMPDARAGECFP